MIIYMKILYIYIYIYIYVHICMHVCGILLFLLVPTWTGNGATVRHSQRFDETDPGRDIRVFRSKAKQSPNILDKAQKYYRVLERLKTQKV